jgi:hypothetical protein
MNKTLGLVASAAKEILAHAKARKHGDKQTNRPATLRTLVVATANFPLNANLAWAV